jgi:D-alanyl-D-alanine carboxypeptidase
VLRYDIEQLHRELGIPADYAAVRGLDRVNEAKPEDLRPVATVPKEILLIAPAAEAWMRLREAAAGDGIKLEAVSGFRSVGYQADLFRRKRARGMALESILRVNIAPGFSEHHSGRAVDIATPGDALLTESFAGTPAFAWLQQHAAACGFTLSYPENNPHGIQFEPWHWLWSPLSQI